MPVFYKGGTALWEWALIYKKVREGRIKTGSPLFGEKKAEYGSGRHFFIDKAQGLGYTVFMNKR